MSKYELTPRAKANIQRLKAGLHTNWRGILSICAIFISVCALVSSIGQAQLSAKHDQLSVRPALTFTAVTTPDTDPVLVQRHIRNNGLGPAFIKKFQIFYDGEMIEENTCTRALKILVKAQKEFSEKTASMFGCLKKGDVLARDEVRPLIGIKFPKENAEEKNAELNNLADRFGFIVKYESAYKNHYTATVGDVGEEK